MKKITVFLLGLFVCLGGILFSACENKVNLTVSDKYVTIYKNDENGVINYLKKDITISTNAFVDVFEGDCVYVTQPQKNRKGDYVFTIHVLEGDCSSDKAEIHVTSIDNSQWQPIYVNVKTVATSISTDSSKTQGLFVVKDDEKGNDLSDTYFEFEPITANEKDISWVFDNDKTSIENDAGETVAEIIENQFYVYTNYSLPTISLKASLVRDPSIPPAILTYTVLNGSVFDSVSLTGKVLKEKDGGNAIANLQTQEEKIIYAGEIQTGDFSFQLKRNESDNDLSKLSGQLVLNVQDGQDLFGDLTLTPVFYQLDSSGNKKILEKAEYEQYFSFKQESGIYNAGKMTYQFSIDAHSDSFDSGIDGVLYFYLDVSYQNFDYSVSTQDVPVEIVTSYKVIDVDISNSNGDSIDNGVIDVYSSYASGDGFKINTLLKASLNPNLSNIRLDDNRFYLSLDVSKQNDDFQALAANDNFNLKNVFVVTIKGTELNFLRTGNTFIADLSLLTNGADIYVRGSESIENFLTNVRLDFVSQSDFTVQTSVFMNLYKIASQDSFGLKEVSKDGVTSEIMPQYFMSTVPNSDTNTLVFNLRVYGLSSIFSATVNERRLMLEHTEDARFYFSEVLETGHSDDLQSSEEQFVDITFTVSLKSYNFEAKIIFWFEHVTGKSTQRVEIDAFVPLDTASIETTNSSSASIYMEDSDVQNYFLETDGSVGEQDSGNLSISKIVVEAGSLILLRTQYQFSTSVQFKAISLEELSLLGRDVELDSLFQSKDDNYGIDYAVKFFREFADVTTNYSLNFNIQPERLTLANNTFKGYVCAIFSGYNERHENLTLLRFFALESIYAVNYLMPEVKSKTLYTVETLSETDVDLARMDVVISARADGNLPTYFNLDNFKIISSTLMQNEANNENLVLFSCNEAGEFIYQTNDYYTISSVSVAGGRTFRFTIEAQSTNLRSSFSDTIIVVYTNKFNTSYSRTTTIDIEIQNVKRVEEVVWTNKVTAEVGQEPEIYLNLTSKNESERTATISTAVGPNDAYVLTNSLNVSSVLELVRDFDNDSAITITQNKIGNVLNLKINPTNEGTSGYVYLLPKDMIKSFQGTSHIMAYRYDENNEKGIVDYIPLKELPKFYDDLVGIEEETDIDGEYLNYFYSGDKKVYNKSVILKIRITVADGSPNHETEEEGERLAIRIYSERELQNIDTAKWYRIMNNIQFTQWKSFENFTGRIFGNTENISLNFVGENNEVFVKNNGGTLKNLIFTGNVVSKGTAMQNSLYAGFVANVNEGTLNNVSIDVSGVKSSLLTTSVEKGVRQVYVGGLVGFNMGNIINSKSYGLSIEASNNADYVGGIVGENAGTISGCGVEFYDFENDEFNKINAPVAQVGGLIGVADRNSRLIQSYVYAYSLEDYSPSKTVFLTSGNKALFIASVLGESVKIVESFGFVGTLKTSHYSETGASLTMENCYYTYYESGKITTSIYKDYNQLTTIRPDYTLNEDDIPKTNPDGSVDTPANFENAVNDLKNSTAWEVYNIDESVNFGFMHLKNTKQTVAVSIGNLAIKTSSAEPYKSLRVGDVNDNKGILFFYQPIAEIVDTAEQSELLRYNTINFMNLFEGVSQQQQRSLIVTTNSESVLINATSLQILSINTKFELVVHSKMDYSNAKTFTVAIINNLPQTTVKIGETPFVDNQIVLLQKGNRQQRVVYTLKNYIYLNGKEYETKGGFYEVDYCFGADSTNENEKQNEYVSIGASNNTITLTGLEKTEENTFVDVTSFVRLHSNSGVDSEFASAVRFLKSNHFRISVFEGATSFTVEDETINLKGMSTGHFVAYLTTDDENDELAFGFSYGEQTREISIPTSSKFVLDIDENLSLEFKSSKEKVDGTENEYIFSVSVKIVEEKLYLIEQEYENIRLRLTPSSQIGREGFLREVVINVSPKEIDDIYMAVYEIKDRTIRDSRTYYIMSDKKISTLIPSTDAILVVQVDPAFALMDTLKLSVENVVNDLSRSVSITRLSKNGQEFYVSNRNTTSNGVGLDIALDDEDLKGDGLYYFRIYVTSSFELSETLEITASFEYNGETVRHDTIPLIVDYIPSASIKVNGVSTYLMSKGSSATVTVTLRLDEKLADFNPELQDLYLQGHGSGIFLTDWTSNTVGSSVVYTATIICYVNATLQNGDSRGIFYVAASVVSVVEGKVVTRVTRATICLVDFTIDGENISLSQTGVQYNNYDVYHAYYDIQTDLNFNYPLLPEKYEYYDPFNANEAEAVEKMMEEREKFFLDNSYEDPQNEYFINYSFDSYTGNRKALSLKEQLWFVREDGSEYRIHNGNYWLTQSDFFNIDSYEVEGHEVLRIKGTAERGQQLMKLQTTVRYQGTEFVYDYYFMVIVSRWSDEELPIQITNGEQFVSYLTTSLEPDDYILMNDIVLDDYEPLDTNLVKSLDGNGYTIHINSWKKQEGSEFKYALFNSVYADTVLKNVRVNMYEGGQISVDVSSAENPENNRVSVQVAGFAISNEGIIYNCEVVSFKSSYQNVTHGTNGIVVKYTKGIGADEIALTDNWRVDSTVAGFVINNSKSIVNCRVGGTSFRYAENILGTTFLSTQDLGVFTIQGQKNVSGFVGNNGSNGYISASFVDNVQINNNTQSSTSVTAGFVIKNENSIQGSYVEGKSKPVGEILAEICDLTNISSTGIVAGFVYDNASLIKNCYSNIGIENEKLVPSFASGFVYINEENATINLCYSASPVKNNDINQLPFSGVAGGSAGTYSLNYGKIERSYFYNSISLDTTNEGKFSTGATPVSDIIDAQENLFYGFSFTSSDDSYDGIWRATETGITLVSANKIAFSNRIAAGGEMFYNKTIYDSDTLRPIDISYGSENNPIIIRNARDFAMATGDATSVVVSAYREYYTDKEVFGTYRLVNNIDMEEINQDVDEGVQERVSLKTSTKTFSGILDGNGFKISNITLRKEDGDTARPDENFGLFAKIQSGTIMNLDLTVSSVYNLQANMVGTLAGTAIDSRILSITLSPSASAESDLSVQGKNVVGGVVGVALGESNLFDINVSQIEIFSRYRNENKEIPVNNSDFRELAMEGYSLLEVSNNISYVGAVAGYVDIYRNFLDAYVQYNPIFDIKDFNIVNVHVHESVDIYGEIAGGLFGYVGKSTYVYDATMELDARENLQTPSYITSKNMFAGGLVGENYGGLFAVQASYEEELQDEIEENEHSYYTSSSGFEFGQKTIFSRTERDENFIPYHNDVKYIGGLVGYMGGGYIHIGYSKLNTISYNPNTIAVGGIIGLLGHDKTTTYQLTSIEGSPYVNIFLKDVYSSGDIYIDVNSKDNTGTKHSVAGIIGAILQNDDRGDTSIALQNVLAENYLSYTSTNGSVNLVGDEVSVVEGRRYSTNHNIIAGKIIDLNGNEIDNVEGGIVQNFAGNFFIVNSINSTFNVFNNTYSSKTDSGADTVGGYRDIMIGSRNSQQIIQLRPFGFKASWMPEIPTSSMVDGTFDTFEKVVDNYIKTLYDSVLCTTHIGDNSSDSYMLTMAGAYVQNNKYFLENGWEARYWLHTQDKLYPHIQLVPVTDIYFWDDYNTDEIMSVMNSESGTSATIILRGKVDEENEHSAECKDIDLRTPNGDSVEGQDINGDGRRDSRDIFESIRNFSGRLISYSAYTHDESMGKVSETQVIKVSGKGSRAEGKILGGNAGEDVGIILDRPMFANFGIGGNAQIEGINFYFCHSEGNDFIDYSLVQEPELEGVESQPATSINNALFRDVRLTLNTNVRMLAKEFTPRSDDDDSVSYATGLIVPVAYATTFNNITIASRDGGLEFVSNTAENANIYMGALVGYLRQNTSYINISLQGINFEKQVSETVEGKEDVIVNDELDVTYTVGAFNKIFAGLYAGKIARGNAEGNEQLARINIGLSTLKNVNLNISGTSKGEEIYVGGFAGEIVGVDDVSFTNVTGSVSDNNMTIRQNIRAKKLYAGLAFGNAKSSTFSIESNSDSRLSLSGGIYQVGDNVCDSVSIGGLVGYINNNVRLSSISIKDFIVARISNVTDSVKDYYKIEADNKTEGSGEDGEEKEPEKISIFEKSLSNYSEYLHPYIVNGATKTDGDSIGGLFGFVSGSNISLNGRFEEVSGVLDVSIKTNEGETNPYVNVGGLIGKTTGSLNAEIFANINMNVSVKEEENLKTVSPTAYVGGIIGLIERPTPDTDGSIGILPISINDRNLLSQYVHNNGVVISEINNLVYGGAIGYVKGQKFKEEEIKDGDNTSIKINNFVFGGAVRTFVSENNNESVIVGGVVGKFEIPASLDSGGEGVYKSDNVVINRAYSYGDVFVAYRNDSLKLSEYISGGIVGVGAPIKISSCASIMTNFNSRLLNKEDNKSNYNVGAIAGKVNLVQFENNKYSSVVCLAYQIEDGNIDCPYGNKENYLGYSVDANYFGDSTENILTLFTNTGAGSRNLGHKLNPINNISNVNSDSYKFHNITWANTTEDLVLKNKIRAGSNIALIGNGSTIKRQNSGSVLNDRGGFVDSLGSENIEDFALISGYVIDFDNFTFDGENSFGGVAGEVKENSIIYAVGVEGKVSAGVNSAGVNNESKKLNFSGIAGTMSGGMINECYVNLDMQYRAKGSVSGIANVTSPSVVIKSTYSAGEIELLVSKDQTVSLLISCSSENSPELIDCYSITQVKENYTASSNEETNLFLCSQDKKELDTSSNNVINASYSLEEGVTADEMAMPYDLAIDTDGSIIKSGKSLKWDEVGSDKLEDKETPTMTDWFYAPFTNNGYATHGFGFLKNMSLYTRQISNKETLSKEFGGDVESNGVVVPTYSYTKVDYLTALNNWKYSLFETPKETVDTTDDVDSDEERKWFLGVANSGKYKQMVDAVIIDNKYYQKDYRFRLENDMKIKDSIGSSVGKADKNLIIDGDNHTISIENGNGPLFNNVYGCIENLRLVDVYINNSNISEVGTLANTIVNKNNIALMNITVIGEISSSKNAGGVVGILTGTAVAVDSVVNVTVKDGGCIAGGIAAKLSAESKISYSSNAGQIVIKSKSDSGCEFTPLKNNGTEKATNISDNPKFHAIAGGIVGIAENGSVIEHCYNDNGVLSGFTGEVVGNYSAGGIVGYVVGDGKTDSSNTRLEGNVNTALVGAGNYAENGGGYAYAGGILGYSNNSNLNITDNVNNGPVQALGYMPEELQGVELHHDQNVNNGNRVFIIKTENDKNTLKGNTVNFESVENKEPLNLGDLLIIGKEGNDNDRNYIKVVISKNGVTRFTNFSEDSNGYFEKILKSEYITWWYISKGTEKTVEPTNSPENLDINVNIVYNPLLYRQVYAFGIGYSCGGKSENNSTTIDNIKNDGCIGEVVESKTLTFERANILSNPEDNKNFWGAFSLQTEPLLMNSGYDSYGFPNRLYAVDEITRMYKFNPNIFTFNNTDKTITLKDGESPKNWNNEIFDAFSQTVANGFGWHSDWGLWGQYEEWHLQNRFNVKNFNEYSIDKASLTKQGNDAIKNNDNNGLGFINDEKVGDPYYNWADFMMPQTTKYASSVEFTSYDELLKGNLVGILGENNIDNASTKDEDANKEANDKIRDIENKTDNDNFEKHTIDGIDTAFVSSGADLSGVLNPYGYTASFTLEQLNDLFYGKFSWSERDLNEILKHLSLRAGGSEAEFEISSADFRWEDGILKVSVDLPNECKEFYLAYKSEVTKENIKLGKKNIVKLTDGVDTYSFDITNLVNEGIINSFIEDYSGDSIVLDGKTYNSSSVRYVFSNNFSERNVRESDLNDGCMRMRLFFVNGGQEYTFSIDRFIYEREINGQYKVYVTPEQELDENGNVLFKTESGTFTWKPELSESQQFGLSIEKWMVTTQNATENISKSQLVEGTDEIRITGNGEKTVNVKMYNSSIIRNIVDETTFEIVDENLIFDMSKLIDGLTSELPEEDRKIAFGNTNFGINFTSGTWNIDGSSSFNYNGVDYNLIIDSGKLKITCSDTPDFDAVKELINSMDIYYNLKPENYVVESAGLNEETKSVELYSSGSSTIELEVVFSWKPKPGQDLISGTTESFFGLDFNKGELVYINAPKTNSGFIRSNNLDFAYEIRDKDNSSLLIGDYDHNIMRSGLEISWNNWDFSTGGIGLSIKLSRTGIENVNIDTANNSVSLTHQSSEDAIKKEISVVVSNREEFKIDNNTTVAGNYVETIYTYSEYETSDDKNIQINSTKGYSYNYKVFEDGSIIVDYYIVISKMDSNSRTEEYEYKGFSFYKDSNGAVKKYKIDYKITYKYEGDNVETSQSGDLYKYVGEGSINDLDSFILDLELDNGEKINYTIYTDYVATYLGSGIRFARYNDSTPLSVDVLQENKTWSGVTSNRKNALYIDDSYVIEKDTEYGGKIDDASSFNYRLDGARDWKEQNGNEFVLSDSAKEDNIYNYDFKYSLNYQSNKIETSQTSVGKDETGKFGCEKSDTSLTNSILMIDDVCGNIILNREQLVVYGAGHFWKYHSSEVAVSSAKLLSNIKLIVATQTGIFDSESSVDLTNVSIYGNVSNFNGNLNILTLGNVQEKVSSYLAISSLDNPYNMEQTITEASINGSYEEETLNLKNIILAGNGENGENGKNGEDGNETDLNGQNGGLGGSIKLMTENCTLVRVGVAGHGGYGADGVNGYFDTDNSKIVKGTTSGKAGETPNTDGKIQVGTVGKNINSAKTRIVFKSQSAGCGGIRGFSVIDCSYAGEDDLKNIELAQNKFYSVDNQNPIPWINYSIIHTRYFTQCYGALENGNDDEWYIPDALSFRNYHKTTTERVENYWTFGNAYSTDKPSVFLKNGEIEKEELEETWLKKLGSGLGILYKYKNFQAVENINISIRAQQVQERNIPWPYGGWAEMETLFTNDTKVRFGDVKVVEWTDGKDINYGGEASLPNLEVIGQGGNESVIGVVKQFKGRIDNLSDIGSYEIEKDISTEKITYRTRVYKEDTEDLFNMLVNTDNEEYFTVISENGTDWKSERELVSGKQLEWDNTEIAWKYYSDSLKGNDKYRYFKPDEHGLKASLIELIGEKHLQEHPEYLWIYKTAQEENRVVNSCDLLGNWHVMINTALIREDFQYNVASDHLLDGVSHVQTSHELDTRHGSELHLYEYMAYGTTITRWRLYNGFGRATEYFFLGNDAENKWAEFVYTH